MKTQKNAGDQQMMQRRTGMLPGLILLAMGVIFLLNNFGITFIHIDKLWPVFLIIPGIYMILGLHRRN